MGKWLGIGAIGLVVTFLLFRARAKAVGAYADAPDVGERFGTLRRQAAKWFSYTLIGGLFVFPAAALGLWALLVGVTLAAATYTAHQRVLHDKRSHMLFIVHNVRAVFAQLGTWLWIMFAPVIAADVGADHALAAGAVVIAGGLVWHALRSSVYLWLMKGRHVHDEALLASLREVVALSEVPTARVVECGLEGSPAINAFAVAGSTHSFVMLTPALVDRFTQQEVRALFGQQIAHVERLTKGRRRVGLLLFLLGAGALLPFIASQVPDLTTFANLWFVIAAMAYSLTQATRPAVQLACDRRGVELCGDPELFINALTKMHVLSAFPRDYDPESNTVIASLAERIAAIRQYAPAPNTSAADIFILPTEDPTTWLAFETQSFSRIQVMSALLDPTLPELKSHAKNIESIAYRSLKYIRLDAQGTSATRLKWKTLDGEPTEIAFDGRHVAQLGTVLQRIWNQVPRFAPKAQHLLAKQAGWLAAVVSFCPGVPGALLPLALLAMLSRRLEAKIAVAGAQVAILPLILLGPWHGWVGPAAFVTDLLLVAQTWAILAERRYEYSSCVERQSKPVILKRHWLFCLSALGLACYLTQFALQFYIGADVSFNVVSAPSAFMFLGAGCALALDVGQRKRVYRWVAWVVIAVLSVSAACKLVYPHGFAQGPAAPVSKSVTPRLAGSLEISGYANDIVVSPSGKRIAISNSFDAKDDTTQFLLLDTTNPSTKTSLQLDARQFAFIDDDHVLALEPFQRPNTLRVRPLTDLHTVDWELPLAEAEGAHLSELRLSPPGDWVVSGRTRAKYQVWRGKVGEVEVQRAEQYFGSEIHHWTTCPGFASSVAIRSTSMFNRPLSPLINLLAAPERRSRIDLSMPGQPMIEHKVDADLFACGCTGSAEFPVVCNGHSGFESIAFAVAANPKQPPQRIEGGDRWDFDGGSTHGTLTGWNHGDNAVILLPLAGRQGVSVSMPAGQRCSRFVTAGNSIVCAATSNVALHDLTEHPNEGPPAEIKSTVLIFELPKGALP